MDSRTGFSIALVLLGFGGFALLFSGKFKNVLAALQQPGDAGWQSDAGSADMSQSAGGSWSGKSSGSSVPRNAGGATSKTSTAGGANGVAYAPAPTINQNPYGSLPIAGTDGLAIAPYGVGASA